MAGCLPRLNLAGWKGSVSRSYNCEKKHFACRIRWAVEDSSAVERIRGLEQIEMLGLRRVPDCSFRKMMRARLPLTDPSLVVRRLKRCNVPQPDVLPQMR